MTHEKWIAKKHRIALADFQTALAECRTTGTQSIRTRVLARGGRCTIRKAQQRYDKALAAAAQYCQEHEKGEQRRQLASVRPSLTIDQRRVRQIKRLLPFWPGKRYSGDTVWRVRHCDAGVQSADTDTSQGDQYSRGCTYKRTDAHHKMHINLSDLIAARRTPVPLTVDGWMVVRAKQVRDSIFEVTLIGTKGKSATDRQGFVAIQQAGRAHLAKTERGAVTALNRDMRRWDEDRLRRIDASIVRSWGWCAAGVRQWCVRHGIRRRLEQRLRRGADSKAIARLIARHGGPRDSYERRLIHAAD